MNLTVLSKIKSQKIGKTPVVVLPLKMWEEIENKLEDLKMMQSNFLKKKNKEEKNADRAIKIFHDEKKKRKLMKLNSLKELF